MLKDITIGQFYPVESKIHNLDPRVKIVAVFVYLISLFIFSSFLGYAIVTFFLFWVIYLSKVPFSYIVKGLKPILFLLLFTAVFNIFGTHGDILFQWKFISVTWQGLRKGIFMSMRLIYLVLGSSMLTYTTTPNKLTDGLETLFRPLKKVGVPVHDFAMMMSLALRFIPTLLEETNRIIQAQSSRGADFEEGNIIHRMKMMISILVPLLVSSTKRAYDLALAMEARCYRGGKGRTKMKPLQYTHKDYLMYAGIWFYLVVIIVLTHFVTIPF